MKNIWNTPAPSLRWPVKLAVIPNIHRDIRSARLSPLRQAIEEHKQRRRKECAKVQVKCPKCVAPIQHWMGCEACGYEI